ncbi:MAG: ATP-binding protein [Bacteroidales bacterium]|nr:ATP-binding protein [Bacteroidales bacterium]
MLYIFIINGRRDMSSMAREIERQISEVGSGLEHEIYRTTGVGDATRFVRIWCDLHSARECCFVACGGTGMVSEVAAGMVGFPKKYLGVLAFGENNDFVRYYSDRDFTSLRKLLAGDARKIDIIRVNDDYAINMVSVGFGAAIAGRAHDLSEEGRVKHAIQRGILYGIFTSMRNRIRVVADGKKMNRRTLFNCSLGNGKWSSGGFMTAPYADNEDGLIELSLVRRIFLTTVFRLLPQMKKGEQLDKNPGKRKIKYARVRHVSLVSSSLTRIILDGEILSGHTFEIDILPKEINLIVPSLIAMKKRFEPIIDKCGEIIDYLMSSPDIPQDEALQFKIRLSIEEAVENVVRYAYEGGLGWLEVGTELDPEGVMLTIILKDAGIPFNPLEKEDPDVTLSAEDREIGGLGIFLCKQLMDHIEYKYEDGCNVLIMKKKVV